MKKTRIQKLLALALCAVMLAAILPAAAMAEPSAIQAAVNSRNMGTWYFPVAEEYFARISDYCGERGSNSDLLTDGRQNGQCKFPSHASDPNGNGALHIEIYAHEAGTVVMAPTDGTLYRTPYADATYGNAVVIEKNAGSGYSYYIILSNLSADAPVVSGTSVTGGNVVGYTGQTYPLQLACVMDYSGKGSQIANNLSGELNTIGSYGWLTESYGIGRICVNPSSQRYTSYRNIYTDFLNGPVTYMFTSPTYVTPVTPTEPVPTVPPETTPTQPIPTEHVHSFDRTVAADTYLCNPASCTSAATYYYSCACGERGTATFSTGMPSDHSWNGGVVTREATHTSNGEITYTCNNCGATKKDTIPASGSHVYDQTNTASQFLKTPATCTTPAVYYKSCVCGATGSETFTYGNAMGHTFSSAWSSDNNAHWHAATCEHTSEFTSYGAHTWDAGRVSIAPSHNRNGERAYTCTVCSAVKTESIPSEAHAFTQCVAAPRYLKTAATCTAPAVYYKSCECGEPGTDTFTYGEAAGHTFADTWTSDINYHWHAATCGHTNETSRLAQHIWNSGSITRQPTETTYGEKTYTCSVCGRTKTEQIAPSAHVHTFAANWTVDNNAHWHAATCQHTTETKDYGLHIWNGGVITSNNGSQTEVTYTCATCGAIKKEYQQSAHTHVYNQRNTSAGYLKSYATCSSPAVYYVSCSCGAKGTETFTYGNAQGHSYSSKWTFDSNFHWRACTVCGAQGDIASHYIGNSNVCSTCGYTRQSSGGSSSTTPTQASHIHTSHLTKVPAKEATCTMPGNVAYFVCECGTWFTDSTATQVISDHSSVTSPATGHVDANNDGKCDVCKTRIETQTVSYQITEGADSTWINSSTQGLVFRANSEFNKFERIEIDGSTVSSQNYTASSGSTIIELNASYLKRLSLGTHKLTILAKDGRADTTFTIKQASAINPSSSSNSSALWTVVAIVALLALIAAGAVGGYLYYTGSFGGVKKHGGKFSK